VQRKFLKIKGIDEIHIGLNDLHLSYHLPFMFQLLSNGTVDSLCHKFQKAGLPYGFGGIAKIGEGLLPSEMVIMEHYRLGSTRAILSRSFCDTSKINDLHEIDQLFHDNLSKLRAFEATVASAPVATLEANRQQVNLKIGEIVKTLEIEKRRTNLMEINQTVLAKLNKTYGDAFYFLDSKQFAQNYSELTRAFSRYEKFCIAYSYKTNYTPKLCRIVDEMGGFAEVVSEMEMEIALRLGVKPAKIIWNGPVKNLEKVSELLLLGGTVNLDSKYEIEAVASIAQHNPKKQINIGIRCNFDVGDGVISRFGFDVNDTDFKAALALPSRFSNIHLAGLQCHFASRYLETWPNRVKGMLSLVDKLGIIPDHIDLGGGLFGKMPDSLKAQFSGYIPTYQEYADKICPIFSEHFASLPYEKKPLLLIEPGTALVGDCMKFACKVINIKTIRGKAIASVLGSVYNINPTLNKKNPPLVVIPMGKTQSNYNDLDFGGFTCIESDYLYRHYSGPLATGDFVVFGNVGSYSIVLKPPFILPNFPVLDIGDKTVEVIKRAENFDDLFHTFSFK
jgi:diaminopimelate decarboxylase